MADHVGSSHYQSNARDYRSYRWNSGISKIGSSIKQHSKHSREGWLLRKWEQEFNIWDHSNDWRGASLREYTRAKTTSCSLSRSPRALHRLRANHLARAGATTLVHRGRSAAHLARDLKLGSPILSERAWWELRRPEVQGVSRWIAVVRSILRKSRLKTINNKGVIRRRRGVVWLLYHQGKTKRFEWQASWPTDIFQKRGRVLYLQVIFSDTLLHHLPTTWARLHIPWTPGQGLPGRGESIFLEGRLL